MVPDTINKTENKILTYESVEISFGGRAVVHDVNFSLKPGEILGLVGESGSGKSTLIKAAMGLLGSDGLVTRGDIRYMGQNILDIPEKEKRKIRGAKIGMIFQDAGASLCSIRTIGEQIYESMCAHTRITRSEAKDRAMDLFDKLNFKDSQRVWDSYPFELSGGMNQRAGIAIAMLMNPPILFADEPTSALDVSVQRQVVKEMLKLRELFGTAISELFGQWQIRFLFLKMERQWSTVLRRMCWNILKIHIQKNYWQQYRNCKGRFRNECTFRSRAFDKNIYTKGKRAF